MQLHKIIKTFSYRAYKNDKLKLTTDSLFFYQLDAQIIYFDTFITFLYMFRALLCSSSGGQLY